MELIKAYKDLTKYKSLTEAAKDIEASPEDVWTVLSGGVALDLEFAEKMSALTGIKISRLMKHQCQNIRKGVLEWMAYRTQIHVAKLGHITRGRRRATEKEAIKLAKFTGIPVEEWLVGNPWLKA